MFYRLSPEDIKGIKGNLEEKKMMQKLMKVTNNYTYTKQSRFFLIMRSATTLKFILMTAYLKHYRVSFEMTKPVSRVCYLMFCNFGKLSKNFAKQKAKETGKLNRFCMTQISFPI